MVRWDPARSPRIRRGRARRSHRRTDRGRALAQALGENPTDTPEGDAPETVNEALATPEVIW